MRAGPGNALRLCIHSAACRSRSGSPSRSLRYNSESSDPSPPITCQIRQRGDAALLNPRECTVDVKLIKQSPALPEMGTALGSSRGRHSREDSGSRDVLFTQPGTCAPGLGLSGGSLAL